MRRVAYSLVAMAVVLGGCASPASRDAMSTDKLSVARKHAYSVSVETRGGGETGAMGSSNISNADLKGAIEQSIGQTGVFRSVVQGKGGDYELTVTVTQLTKPMFGMSFTVTLETAWSLVKTSDRSVALRRAISSSHTAGAGDSMVGVTRLRLAVEGAARKNIAQGLEAIAALSL